jgi:hypothetical protein
MLEYEDIEPGDKWSLNSNPKKVGEVTCVEQTNSIFGPRVELKGGWFKTGFRWMSADVLDAHYTKVSV